MANANRTVVDEKTGVTLVYPDILALNIVSNVDDGSVSTVVIDAQMIADPNIIARIPHSRQIIIQSAIFILRKPSVGGVDDFQFISTGYLSGRAVLSAKKESMPALLNSAKTDSSFFSPEYSGASESFVSNVDVASVVIDQVSFERVRGKALIVEQCSELVSIIQANINRPDIAYSPTLAQNIFDNAQISKIGDHWVGVFEPGGKNAKITRLMERVISISGSSGQIKVVSS